MRENKRDISASSRERDSAVARDSFGFFTREGKVKPNDLSEQVCVSKLDGRQRERESDI